MAKLWRRIFGLLSLGRRLETTGWQLYVSRAVPMTESYRSTEFPTIGDLEDRLSVLGYRFELLYVDDQGDVGGPVDRRTPLIGSSFALRDRRLGPRSTRLAIRISHQIATDRGGIGYLDAVDTRSGHYAELAGFAIHALAGLMPGLRYKRTDSALGPDAAELVKATLPDRPRAFE